MQWGRARRRRLDGPTPPKDTRHAPRPSSVEALSGASPVARDRHEVFGPTGPTGAQRPRRERQHILESIDGSLERLQTDYVDLYLAHRFVPRRPRNEEATSPASPTYVRQGKVPYVGSPGRGAPALHDRRARSRYLGKGLKVPRSPRQLATRISVENDAAIACVRAALDVGISTFDTADVYANTGAETVLGEALKGERRQSLEIATKVFGPTGPKGHNDTSPVLDDRPSGCRPTTSTCTRHTASTTRPRSRRRSSGSAGQGRTSASVGGPGAGAALAKDLGLSLSMAQLAVAWGSPRISQIVWSPIAQGS